MTNAREAKTTREKAAAMRADAARAEARRRNLTIVGLVIGALVVVVAVAGIVAAGTSSKTSAAAPPANVTNDAIVVGKASAPVTLKVYEDFQCPVCADFERLNRTQIDQWVSDGTVKVEYRPLAFLDRASPDRYSTRSLNAVGAVVNATPSAFSAFHTSLFENQPAENGPGLTDDKLISLAVAAGAKDADIRPAIVGLKYESWTKAVTDRASKAGITGTPTVFVNGKIVENWTAENLKAAVDAAAKG